MTLEEYYQSAKVTRPPSFAKYIELQHTPMRHQITGLNAALCRKGFYGLYDDPGTGKTLVAHAYSLYKVAQGHRVLSVMLPTLVTQYHEELHEIFKGIEMYVKAEAITDDYRGRGKLYDSWTSGEAEPPQILSISYNKFLTDYDQLMKVGFQVMITDEAQEFKGHESQRFKKVDAFRHRKDFKGGILMTGTALHNSPQDGYVFCQLTYPDAYRDREHFDRRHTVKKRLHLKDPIRTKRGKLIRSIRQVVGYQRHDELSSNLYRNGRRVPRSAVKEIHDPVIKAIKVKLEPAHKSLYEKLVREKILITEQGRLIDATNAPSLRQKASLMVVCPELFMDEPPKFKNRIHDAVRDIIKSWGIDSDNKMILFANRRMAVTSLAEVFEEYNPSLMYGQSDSETNRKKFLEDPTCLMMIAHPKSAGAGLNLQKVSHNMLFVEPTLVPGDFKQCYHRVVRRGQESEVNIGILSAAGTAHGKGMRIMLGKEDEIQNVMKDPQSIRDYFIAD